VAVQPTIKEVSSEVRQKTPQFSPGEALCSIDTCGYTWKYACHTFWHICRGLSFKLLAVGMRPNECAEKTANWFNSCFNFNVISASLYENKKCGVNHSRSLLKLKFSQISSKSRGGKKGHGRPYTRMRTNIVQTVISVTPAH